ncbi:MAG: hypothetical protein EBW87_02580 [Burkholderiaceae bacterium]|nr:hypothetical protein [Burkholderiaceae bacterium]
MATAALSGLFGGNLTPEEQQMQMTEARAAQFAKLDPSQQLAFMGYKAGANLGQGLAQAAGVDIQDPAIKRATQLRQLAQDLDVTTTNGLAQYAQRLQQAGFNAEAAQLGQAITARRQQETQSALTAMKTSRELQAYSREDKLQAELAALPEGATEEDILKVMRVYGDPKTVAAGLERSAVKKAEIEAKAQLEREKAQLRADEKERDRAFKEEMIRLQASLRQSNSDVQRQLIQTRIDALNDKKQEKIDKQIAAAESAVGAADRIIGKVDEAIPLVSNFTTGFGSVTTYIPGTPGANLRATIETIKANLGFDRLQQMRDASPTGGALGQVAVKELDALQASVSSLDLNQSSERLRNNLEQIKTHYSRWRQAATGKLPEEKRTEPGAGALTPSTAPATPTAGGRQTSKGTKYTIIE